MSLKEVKELLAPQNPFIFGKYPDKPAPAHVINGFIAASLGVSDRSNEIRRLIASDGEVPSGFRFIEQANWTHDLGKLSALRHDLSLMFNPDRRMWEKIGSPVPVHAYLATADPSDEGLGPLLWQMINRFVPPGYEERLAQLFCPVEAADPLTACSMILVEGAKIARKREVSVRDSSWFGAGGTQAGSLLARRLSEFLDQLTRPEHSAKRLMQIQHLERGLYLTAILALLMGPLAASIKQQIDTVDEIGMIVVWSDSPPGPPNHPMVSASIRSLQILIERLRRALVSTLAEALAGQELPTQLPSKQRLHFALRSHLGTEATSANVTIEQLCKDAGVSSEDVDPGNIDWCRQVVESAYNAAELTKGFRSMGHKIGFLGPDRGAGAPRFVCETPLLGTLVAGLCPEDSIEFSQFVDLIRERMGIIFGPGTQEDLAERLNLWEGAGIGGRILRDNQESLRQRLIRAGLAREYSDGHTEVSYGV